MLSFVCSSYLTIISVDVPFDHIWKLYVHEGDINKFGKVLSQTTNLHKTHDTNNRFWCVISQIEKEGMCIVGMH